MIFAALVPLRAASQSPDDLTSSSEDLSQYLGPIYKDEIAGIKIATPVGCRIINRAGLDLVSFVNDAKQWGGSVQLVGTKENMSVEGYLSSTATELGRTFRSVKILDSRELTFQSRPAGRITTSMEAELGAAPGQRSADGGRGGAGDIIALYRQQLIVQMADRQFMIVTLYAPLKDRDSATATFNAMLSTFELLDRQELAKQRDAAAKLGKEWLAATVADSLKTKLNARPQLFRMKVGGADIGFMQFNELDTSRGRNRGIEVVVTSRGFKPDGSNVSGQFEAFWAYSGDLPPERRSNYSSWERITRTVLNRPNIALAAQTFWASEIGTVQVEGISRFTDEEIAQLKAQREKLLENKSLPPDKIPPPIEIPPRQTHIHVAYEGDRSQPAQSPFDAMIALEHPAVLPSVLDYLWPRTVDLTKKTQMTFVVYSFEKKNLVYRTLSVEGRDHIVIGKQPVDCYRCLDEMESSSTTLWVNDQGQILMMRTSDQALLLPTTGEEMQAQWGPRLQQPH